MKREFARVSMPASLYKKLKEKAKEEMLTISAVIRQAIKKYL